MVVKTVNYNPPDENGNVNIQMLEGPVGDQGIQGPRGIQGVQGERGPKGDKGDPAIFFNGVSNVKCFAKTVTTANGAWTVDYSTFGFTMVLNVQCTLQATDHSDSEKPLGVNITNITTSSASGDAFCVTSAGLLAAMQQTKVKDGTIVHVMVFGI